MLMSIFFCGIYVSLSCFRVQNGNGDAEEVHNGEKFHKEGSEEKENFFLNGSKSTEEVCRALFVSKRLNYITHFSSC